MMTIIDEWSGDGDMHVTVVKETTYAGERAGTVFFNGFPVMLVLVTPGREPSWMWLRGNSPSGPQGQAIMRFAHGWLGMVSDDSMESYTAAVDGLSSYPRDAGMLHDQAITEPEDEGHGVTEFVGKITECLSTGSQPAAPTYVTRWERI